MSEARFSSAAGFPVDRRVFVLPEPSPAAPAPRPSLREETMAVRDWMRARAGEWVTLTEIAAAVGVTVAQANDAVYGALQGGLVERRAVDPSTAAPQFNREYRWKATS